MTIESLQSLERVRPDGLQIPDPINRLYRNGYFPPPTPKSQKPPTNLSIYIEKSPFTETQNLTKNQCKSNQIKLTENKVPKK